MKNIYDVLYLIINTISAMFIFGLYIAGWVLVKGFWNGVLALVLPVYPFYLVAERLMSVYNII